MFCCLGAGPCERCAACHTCIKRDPAPPPPNPWDVALPAHVPDSFLLSLPSAPDQKNISACAVNACATALHFCLARAGYSQCMPSRMFLYYNTRRYIQRCTSMTDDKGCTLRDVCKAASLFGACDEQLWPYEKRLLATQPPMHLYAAARRAPFCTHHAVPQTLPAMVACLLHNGPIMMGMSVFSNIGTIPEDGYLSMPGPRDKRLGAHAVLVCGYNLPAKRFIVQNCWGAAWANKGYFEVPFEFALNAGHCWDLWALFMPHEKNLRVP